MTTDERRKGVMSRHWSPGELAVWLFDLDERIRAIEDVVRDLSVSYRPTPIPEHLQERWRQDPVGYVNELRGRTEMDGVSDDDN